MDAVVVNVTVKDPEAADLGCASNSYPACDTPPGS
jgi:hypothetical protein